jgi:signal transduction histidine kinase
MTGAAEAIVAELLFGATAPDRIAAVTHEVASDAGLDLGEATLVVFRLVVRDSTFLAVEPAAAIEAQLRSLLLFGRIKHASLWLRADSGTEVCAAAVGATEPRRPVRSAARHALGGGGNGDTALRFVPVGADHGLAAALIFQTTRGKARLGTALAQEAAIALGPIVERRRLLDESRHSAGQLLAAAERRIARLGFDLHDGPMQRLSLLTGELALLSRGLPGIIPDVGARAEAEQRLAHMTDLALEVGRELRDLSRTAATRGRAPLREELSREASQLEDRAGIRVDLAIHGNVEETTPSQRIAVHRVVEEALTNVREHSGASVVHVTLRRDPDFLNLTIEDDGDGFDVPRAFRRASRDGRLGLVSMSERVRLLGGHLDVTSRPGGPTVIVAVVPAWTLPAVSREAHAAETANAVA